VVFASLGLLSLKPSSVKDGTLPSILVGIEIRFKISCACGQA
jgi:hypothetical protein